MRFIDLRYTDNAVPDGGNTLSKLSRIDQESFTIVIPNTIDLVDLARQKGSVCAIMHGGATTYPYPEWPFRHHWDDQSDHDEFA